MTKRAADLIDSHDNRARQERLRVVGVGASAGGLEAFSLLLDAMAADIGATFVLVQHLDPNHKSAMADLLAVHTKMPVVQAADGMTLKPNHVYIAPPGAFLSISGGKARLTAPRKSEKVRLPIDFLFASLASEYGDDAVAVVLSGNGEDGSVGLKVVAAKGGLVIVQEPSEAQSYAMPHAAIATGKVALTLPVAEIARAICDKCRSGEIHASDVVDADDEISADAKAIIDLIGEETVHKFAGYKAGTLQRRIERRMVLSGASDPVAYIARLRGDRNELEALATDMYIHVTGFFRDPASFELLRDEILPGLIGTQNALRIWVAGCSTGEEAYSLAIVCQEAIAYSGLSCRLQIYASDIDDAAVRAARRGFYPLSIGSTMSPARLKRFFVKEGLDYRVAPELRSAVVFTVHDLLVDPPFLHIDLIACRNVMIYLQAKAQHGVLSQFDFALNEGGVLFLGASETVGAFDDRFKIINERDRLFRHRKVIRAEAFGSAGPGLKQSVFAKGREPPRRASPTAPNLDESVRTFLIDSFAPPAVLINDKREVLYSSGQIDRFLQLVSGKAQSDILAMAREGLRGRLRTAIAESISGRRAVTTSARFALKNQAMTVDLSVRPMTYGGIELFLVGFSEAPKAAQVQTAGPSSDVGAPAFDALQLENAERELDVTRQELDAALRTIDELEDAQEAASKEASSVSEEYQVTNEELVTSREELQALNEELTVLNSQLQASLERQKSLASDLQNILDSADLATLFLDDELRIRFFTPETRSVVRLQDGDIGRPLADQTLIVTDPGLLSDAAKVLETSLPIETEVENGQGRSYLRRVLPYSSHGTGRRGVVLTFSDITSLQAATQAMRDARAYADAVIDTTPIPMVVLDRTMLAVSANRAFYRTYAEGSAEGTDGFEPPDVRLSDLPILRILLDKLKTIAVPVENYDISLESPALGSRILRLSAHRIHDGPMGNEKILVLIDDVTERLRIKDALSSAKLEAERANAEKSRFLAAASHDLRQPLQTLSLLHGLLAKKIVEPANQKLLSHFDETLVAMSSILNTLLDINQLEAGIVAANKIVFPIDDVLQELEQDFSVPADAAGLTFRVVRTDLHIYSDPNLLGQMLRNILANALKYTPAGRVLVGCRRMGQQLRIEVWDTGIGIHGSELSAIFEEFHQLDNSARDRTRGLGLGLAIVQRLGDLLGHAVAVRSTTGKGSVFSVEVPLSRADTTRVARHENDVDIPLDRTGGDCSEPHGSLILIIEDDVTVREFLKLLLEAEGLIVRDVPDGNAALNLARSGEIEPSLIITDFDLPNGPSGLDVLDSLRARFQRRIPAIVLTGDISTDTIKAAVAHEAVHVAKPVKADILLGVVDRLQRLDPAKPETQHVSQKPFYLPGILLSVFVIDDDPGIRSTMAEFLQSNGLRTATFASGKAFFDAYENQETGCLIVDARMPDMSGLELIQIFKSRGYKLRVIIMTGYGDVPLAVAAMKAGATDFIEKPVSNTELLACIERALQPDQVDTRRKKATDVAATLTSRQRQILKFVLAGRPSKLIAFDLGISQRTVENHRAAIMKKTASKSLAMLVRTMSYES